MPSEQVNPGVAFVLERFGDEVVEQGEWNGQQWITVKAAAIRDVVEKLGLEAGFSFLDDVTAVDYLDRPEVSGRFRVVYHLLNMESNTLLRLKAHVEDEETEVPTISDLHAGANWMEREVWDMFGIVFANHPDLRRILMPEDYEDFPCRRDFPWHGKLPITDPMREEDFARGVTGEHLY